MSKTYYVNLFHNGVLKYSGFKKKLEPASDGGARPVMIPTKTNLVKSVATSAVRFPYRLKEKNIRMFSSNGFEIAFLVPTRDVPNLTDQEYEESIYYKLTGSDEERKDELEQRLQEKDDKIGKLRKQLRELREEEEEQGKGGSSSSGTSLRCPQCGQVNSESRWRDNNSLCPSCNGVAMDDPEVVRQ